MDQKAALKTFPVLSSASPTAVAVYCGDPRFQAATKQFLESELGMKDGEYVPVIVGGGVASLTEPLLRPKEFKYLKDLLALYLGHFRSVRRVVVINHEDCAKYRVMSEGLGSKFLRNFIDDMVGRQMDDLQKVTKVIASLSHGIQVERYFARFANPEHTEAVFEAQ
jgi:hypothetical protein